MTNNISVLHISTAASWRGGEQQLAYLLKELSERNIRQAVVCTDGAPMQEFCSANGIEVHTSKKSSAFDLAFARKIARVCSEGNFPVIHTHDSHAHTFALLAVQFFGCKAGLIVSRRVDFPIGKGFLSGFKYNHTSVKRILCVSDAIRRIVAADLKERNKAITVHSGIDVSRFSDSAVSGKLRKEFNLRDDAVIIGNVAAIAPHKDYYTFIDTAEKVKNKFDNAVFFIIGDGPERSKVEDYARSKKLENKIIFTGFRKDIPDILPELDIMLITSETEGLGTSILDAFACKVPVVATAAGGIPELVLHEETGLLAPVKDSALLAELVQKLIQDENLKSSLAKNATNHLRHFTTSATAEGTLREYLAVCGVSL